MSFQYFSGEVRGLRGPAFTSGQQAEIDSKASIAALDAETARATAAEAALEADKATKDELQEEFDGRVAGDTAIYEELAAQVAIRDGLISQERLTRTPVLPPTDPSPMAPSYLLTAGKSAPRYDDLIDLIVVMGQSNAGGATVGPAVATTPLYRGRCLSPDIGSRITAGWRFSSFTDAVETYNSGSGEGETILTSMLSHLVQANDSVTGAARRKFAGFVSAVGGEDLAELKRGSFAWENAIQGVEDACNIARDALTELRVPAIVWIQGENQTGDGTTAEQYYNMLRILARDAAEDVMQITGQRIPPTLYIVQTSTVDNALVLNQQVQMAQHRAAGEGWARLVGPLYPYPPAASSGVETIHKNGAGQNLMGQAVARAIFAESQGLGWQALRVRSARLTAANKILIDCDVPVAPLVIDTAGAVDPTGLQGLYGFDVQLPNGTFATISSATIVNGTSVELTMSASITAAWVRLGYAMRRNAATTEDGPAKGARGCIRDSATDANLFGQGTLRNWLCHWTAVIPAAGSF